MENYLEHHGILGMHWGIRRYQNEDGTLTKAGIRHLAKLQAKSEKKDYKWATKNEAKITKKAFKESKSELKDWTKTELNNSGLKGKRYINAYNQKLATLMNTAVTDVKAPSGKSVKFVAKRGEQGVYMALADEGYDMSQVKNGVYGNMRVAYKKTVLNNA